MKSLLVLASAFAVGLSASSQSQYYVGNYTAFSKFAGFVPYPLDVCVPTGYPAPYAMFSCNGTAVFTKQYSTSDATCSKTFTETITKPTAIPGITGFAHCSGAKSYMVIDQYLSSCSGWQKGQSGATDTIIAVNACSLYNISNGIHLYSKSTCNGDGQTTFIYAGDYTCSNSSYIVKAVSKPLGCAYFQTTSGINIYSAMRQCVLSGVSQRCTTGLADYSAVVTFTDITSDVDFTALYTSLFPYATVTVSDVMYVMGMNSTISLRLNLTFCTKWEDASNTNNVKALGTTTLNSGQVTAESVCWKCDHFKCRDNTSCGTDSYCSNTEQCAYPTTTTVAAKSAFAIYVSVFTLITLLLSVSVF